MRTHVIYGSQYGHAKTYAEWVADSLTENGHDVQLVEAGRYEPTPSEAPDVFAYVGGNYAGSLHRVEKFVDAAHAYPQARLAVLTVGMASAERADEARSLWKKNIPEDLRSRTEFCHARGGLDYSRLTKKHKIIMTAVRGFITAKPQQKRHAEDQQLLDTWGEDFDFTSRDQIEPLVEALTR